MGLVIVHDGSKPGDVMELCCMCRAPTRYWHKSDVALCPPCAKTTKRSDLPTKREWLDKEAKLSGRKHWPFPHQPTRTAGEGLSNC